MLLGAWSAGTTTSCREQGFCNCRICECRCCFCALWPSEFSDLNLNQRPNTIEQFWKGINLLFFSLCLFSGIVPHRVHQKFQVVLPIYGPWFTIFMTFSKDFMAILIVYYSQIPRNDVASRTIFEWRIVARTIRRFSLEAINAEVLQYTFIVKDVGCNGWSIGILNDRNRLIFEIKWNPNSNILPRLMAFKPLFANKSGRKGIFSMDSYISFWKACVDQYTV